MFSASWPHSAMSWMVRAGRTTPSCMPMCGTSVGGSVNLRSQAMAPFAHPPKPLMFSMIVTPMDDRGNIDEAGLRAHCRRMIEAGVGVYVGSGGSGEGHSMDLDELGHLYEIAIDECKGKVPVYCNPPESRSSAEMQRKTNAAIAAAADLCSSTSSTPATAASRCLPN